MSDRFDRYCRQKTNASRHALLPGFTTVAVATDLLPGLLTVGNDWSRRLFDGWFFRTAPHAGQRTPAVSLVFVQSADGNTVADDPSSLGGGDTDKHLVYEGLARVDAHGVLAGSATASGDDLVFSVWHPEMVRLRADRGLPRHPAQIILTERGELPVETSLIYNEPSLRVMVVTSRKGAAALAPRLRGRPWVEVIDGGQPLDVRRALGALYDRGIRVISAIGGRRAAASLLAANAVAELYLTTAPTRGGEPGTPLIEGAWPPHRVLLEKAGKFQERGVRFQHLLFAAR